jgi:hypothetical protein
MNKKKSILYSRKNPVIRSLRLTGNAERHFKA